MEDRLIPLLNKFLNNEPVDSERMVPQIPDTPFSLLTAREFEILHYLLKGIGSKKIGDILNIKYNTVSTAKTHIFEKSQTSDISQLLELAARHRII
jgi:DNA-binding CsgD family transcriptional regulator